MALESLRMVQNFDTSDPESGLKLLENLASDIDGIQQQILKEIVDRNAHTEYLKGFLEGRSDIDLFKKKVPVVDYEDIEKYIKRIVDGETSEILLAQPIVELIRSSGTSDGQQKLMPTTTEALDRKTAFLNLLVAVLTKHIEGLDQGKVMYFAFIRPEFKSPCGLTVVPSITSYYKSSNYRNRPFNKFNVNTSPDEIILCPDMKQSMYCQLLCGLVQRDNVLRAGTSFASALLKIIKFLEDHWQELCSNIRTGYISDWITNTNCRNALSSIISKPMPDLANMIEQECSYKSWAGIIQRLWPKAKCVEVVFTGSMAQYIPRLEFYSGSLPLVSMRYVCSEGYFGVNLNPLCNPSNVVYTLLPNMAYYEFLPFDKVKEIENKIHPKGIHVPSNIVEIEKKKTENDEIVDLAKVQVRQHYELVVTNNIGLYRYRTGDILAVTGFLNNVPQFRFVQRRNALLSVDVEKTSEEDLLKAILEAMSLIEPLGFLLKDYTSCADTSNYPGHYVLFWELQMRGNADLAELDRTLMEQCCLTMEQSLDRVYKMLRNATKEIGPLEIRVVKNGTFDELMDHFISLGSSMSQYKTPRCITSEKTLEMLNSKVVRKFFSKNVPFWSPQLEMK